MALKSSDFSLTKFPEWSTAERLLSDIESARDSVEKEIGNLLGGENDSSSTARSRSAQPPLELSGAGKWDLDITDAQSTSCHDLAAELYRRRDVIEAAIKMQERTLRGLEENYPELASVVAESCRWVQ